MNKLLLCVALLGMGGIYGARAEDPPATVADDLIATRQADMAIQTSLLEAIMMAIGADADIMSLKDAAGAIEALGTAIPELFPEGTERGHNTRALPAVWSDRAGFEKAAANLTEAARRMANAAATDNRHRVRQSQPRDSRGMLHVPHGISRRPYQTVVRQPPGSGRCWTAIQFPFPRGRQIASWDVTCAATYPAISRVARIGNFKTLHNALRFASRGRQWSVSQK